MYGLCISERSYRIGVFRVEWFSDLKFLEHYRSKNVDPGATTWILGEPMPKKREPQDWY